ncbi:MAG: M48 family metalloprotease [Planctomycetes bacterium]|nr:M48 family metalloprotease [Planctomycetota bacterium]
MGAPLLLVAWILAAPPPGFTTLGEWDLDGDGLADAVHALGPRDGGRGRAGLPLAEFPRRALSLELAVEARGWPPRVRVELEGQDADGDGVWSGRLYPAGTADLDGDGRRALLVAIDSGYDLWPRGILAVGPGGLRWFAPTGAAPLEVRHGDLDGDGAEEVLAGCFAYNNGALVDGLDDGRAWLVALAPDGRRLWSRPLGIWYGGVEPLVADTDGDGRPEVVAATHTAFGVRFDEGLVVVLDGRDGAVRHGFRLAASALGVAVADMDARTPPELVIGSADGTVRVTDLDGRLRARSPPEEGPVRVLEVLPPAARGGWPRVVAEGARRMLFSADLRREGDPWETPALPPRLLAADGPPPPPVTLASRRPGSGRGTTLAFQLAWLLLGAAALRRAPRRAPGALDTQPSGGGLVALLGSLTLLPLAYMGFRVAESGGVGAFFRGLFSHDAVPSLGWDAVWGYLACVVVPWLGAVLAFLAIPVAIVAVARWAPALVGADSAAAPLPPDREWERVWSALRRAAARLDVDPLPRLLLDRAAAGGPCHVYGRGAADARVALSPRVLELDDEALETLLVHELAHVKGEDLGLATWADAALPVLRRVGLAAAALYLGAGASTAAWRYGMRLGVLEAGGRATEHLLRNLRMLVAGEVLLAAAGAAVIAAVYVLLPRPILAAIRRQRELLADARAAEIRPDLLEVLRELGVGERRRGGHRWLDSHPGLEERRRALEVGLLCRDPPRPRGPAKGAVAASAVIGWVWACVLATPLALAGDLGASFAPGLTVALVVLWWPWRGAGRPARPARRLATSAGCALVYGLLWLPTTLFLAVTAHGLADHVKARVVYALKVHAHPALGLDPELWRALGVEAAGLATVALVAGLAVGLMAPTPRLRQP